MTLARALRAQQKAMPVIGYLAFGSPGLAPTTAVFLQGLSETGWVEGQNVAIEYRWAEGRYDRLPALAADLVGRKVDVILAATGSSCAKRPPAARSTTNRAPEQSRRPNTDLGAPPRRSSRVAWCCHRDAR
jgi:putative ABC transport system substrate-binding protein